MERIKDILPAGASSRYYVGKHSVAYIDIDQTVKILSDHEGYITIPLMKLSNNELKEARTAMEALLPVAKEEWFIDAGEERGVGIFRVL